MLLDDIIRVKYIWQQKSGIQSKQQVQTNKRTFKSTLTLKQLRGLNQIFDFVQTFSSENGGLNNCSMGSNIPHIWQFPKFVNLNTNILYHIHYLFHFFSKHAKSKCNSSSRCLSGMPIFCSIYKFCRGKRGYMLNITFLFIGFKTYHKYLERYKVIYWR